MSQEMGAVVRRSRVHLTPTRLRVWEIENETWRHIWVPSVGWCLALSCPIQVGRDEVEAAQELLALVRMEGGAQRQGSCGERVDRG